MDAIEFVKSRGIERVSELVNECPDYMYYIGKCGFSKTHLSGFVCKNNLKQIVWAFELVEKRGGLAGAKAVEQQYWNSGVGSAMIVSMELKQAIELVEKCNASD